MIRHLALPATVGCLAFVAFVIGVFFRGFDQVLFAPALLCVLTSAGLMLATGRRDGAGGARGWAFPAGMAMGFLALFWWWITMSFIWTPVPHVSGIFIMLIGAMPLLVFTTLQHPRAQELVRAQMIAVACAMVLVALWALIQFFVLYEYAGTRIHHPMLNTNNLAVLLTMTSFLLLIWFHRAKGGWVVVAGVMLTLVLMAMLTTQSRGGLVGLLLGVAAVVPFCLPVLRREWRRFTILGVMFAIGLVAVFMMDDFRDDAVRYVGGKNSMASVNERFLLLGSGLAMLRDNPFPGIGLGVFYLAFPRYRNFGDTSDGFFLHIDPLQFAIETGIPVLLFFYGFCIAVLWRTIMAVRHAKADDRAMVLLPFSGLVALLFNAHVNFDLYMLPALIMATILLIAWFLATEKCLGPCRLDISPGRIAQRVFIIPALAFLFIAAPVWIVRAGFAVHYTGLASAALARNEMPAVKENVDRALAFGGPTYARGHYIKGVWLSRTLRAQFYILDAARRQAGYSEAQESFDRAIAHNPYYTHAMNQKAVLFSLAYPRLDADGQARARDMLEQSIALDPLNFDARLGYARLLQAQGNAARAVRVLEDVYQWRAGTRYAPIQYRQYLSQVRRAAGYHVDPEAEKEEIQIYTRKAQINYQRRTGIDRWVQEKLKNLMQ